jgi:hypothetical protein
MDKFLAWLRKAADYLRTAGAALNSLAATIEALIALLGPGPGFGFGAA